MARLSKTAQLRQRLTREISRLESRGFIVPEDVKQRALKSWQSVRRFAANRSELLRRAARTPEGLSAEEAERQRRSEAARRAARKRALKAKLETARVIMGNVRDLIQSHTTNGAMALNAALSREIDHYGYFNVAFGMASMPAEIIAKAQEIVTTTYKGKQGRDRIGGMIGAMFTIIHQSFPDQEEQALISELAESYEEYDTDEYEE